jgi:holo-[acyl-carrier protein] synthase
MAGVSGMLVGVGHDIQVTTELTGIESLKIPGLFFTANECIYLNHKNSLHRITGLFSAKEAFFKALPESLDFFWSDLEVLHTDRHAPYFQFHNALLEFFTQKKWIAWLSISHSGEYASTMVVISTGKNVDPNIS